MTAIRCIPLIARMYDCLQCDIFMPFDGNNHCYACGCDSPVGSIDDDTIPEEQWELEQAPFYYACIGEPKVWNYKRHKKLPRKRNGRT